MPIYNDNRLLLGKAEYRAFISKLFARLLEGLTQNIDVIAGTATAGIPHATSLADRLNNPLIYVRAAAKSHGMGNQIEGPLTSGKNVILVEDLISTGGSAVNAINAIRKAGGIVDYCLCIFSYGFTETGAKFDESNCQYHSLLSFPALLEEAQTMELLSKDQIKSLKIWHKDPFKWADTKGL